MINMLWYVVDSEIEIEKINIMILYSAMNDVMNGWFFSGTEIFSMDLKKEKSTQPELL